MTVTKIARFLGQDGEILEGVVEGDELEEISGRLPKALTRTPWEAVVLVVAAAAFYEITTRSSATVRGGGTPHVDRLLLLFPLLFIAGLAGLAVRVLRALLGRSRTAGARRSWCRRKSPR